jgi:hypothetical protein
MFNRQVTVWLRSGWIVIGTARRHEEGTDAPTVPFLRLEFAKFKRAGQDEQIADTVFVPIATSS